MITIFTKFFYLFHIWMFTILHTSQTNQIVSGITHCAIISHKSYISISTYRAAFISMHPLFQTNIMKCVSALCHAINCIPQTYWAMIAFIYLYLISINVIFPLLMLLYFVCFALCYFVCFVFYFIAIIIDNLHWVIVHVIITYHRSLRISYPMTLYIIGSITWTT